MALDPSIGLGFKPTTPFDPMGAAKQGMQLAQMGQQIEESKQNIAASKASQAHTEAQTPGAAADSEQKQRGLRYINWEQANKHKFVKPDGTIDTNAYVNHAANEGFGDFAAKVATSDLTRTADQIKNSTSQIDQGVKVQEFNEKTAAHAATLISAAPEKDRPALLRKIMDATEVIMPGSGKYVFGLFGSQDDQGKVGVDNGRLDAVRTATMTPQQQENLKMQKDQQAKAFELTMQSPDAYATTGPQVNAAYTALRAAGIGEDKVPNGLSMNDLARMGYEDIIKGSVTAGSVSTQSRQEYLNKFTEAQKDIANIKTALKVVETADTDVLGTKPGQIGSAKWNLWVKQNPQFSGLETAVARHNAAYPNDPIDPGTMSLGQIQAKLQQTLINRTNDSDIYYKASKTQQLPKGDPAGAVPSKELPKGVPAAGPAGTNKPSGQTVTMQHVKKYAADKGIPETEVLKMMDAKGIKVTQ